MVSSSFDNFQVYWLLNKEVTWKFVISEVILTLDVEILLVYWFFGYSFKLWHCTVETVIIANNSHGLMNWMKIFINVMLKLKKIVELDIWAV